MIGLTVGGKAGGDGDHLVARHQSAVAQPRRCQRRQRQQVGRRARVDQQRVALAGALRQRALEGGCLGAGGEPEVKAGTDELDNLLRAEHAAGRRDAGIGRIEGSWGVAFGGVRAHELEDMLGARLGGHRTA
jgi:hypothetical protein